MPGECQGSEVRVGTLVGDQARKAGVTLVTTGYKQGLRTIISTLRPFIRYLVNQVSVDEPIDLSGVSGIVPNGFYRSPEGGPSHDITATIFFKSCTPIFIFLFCHITYFYDGHNKTKLLASKKPNLPRPDSSGARVRAPVFPDARHYAAHLCGGRSNVHVGVSAERVSERERWKQRE